MFVFAVLSIKISYLVRDQKISLYNIHNFSNSIPDVLFDKIM